ncbi:MAG: terpene cyclase/mutase family protein [Lentisphaeraceae bacterium]|nr:terpene cyclase/mutase family protein [Lentisphaeraceae bacterium]
MIKVWCVILSVFMLGVNAQEKDTIAEISPEMTRSLGRGLKSLASKQQPDGSWRGNYGRNVGETSLCIMSFMSMGHLPGEGEFGHIVGKGVQWVLKQAKPSGLIQYTQGQQEQAAVMYGHALATLMLSEAWGQTRRKDVGKVLRNAVNLILQVQGKKGGWGYKSVPEDGDTSVCVMQVFALKSAQDAGIYVPSATIEKALKLIKTRYNSTEAMFGYSSTRISEQHSGSSAAGTCIMQICGENDKTYTEKPLEKLHEIMGRINKAKIGHKPYFLYYSSVASFNNGSRFYRPWVKLLEPYLLDKQNKDGSWGTHYQTAFCILAASLPFQYIPVYQK